MAMRRIRSGCAGTVLLCALTLAGPVGAETPATIALFSDADAEALRLTDEDIVILSAQSKAFMQGGPEIVWLFPELGDDSGRSAEQRVEFVSPSSLTIEFRKTLASIDFESLDVRGRKFGFTKSVTDLVLPYLRGNLLAAEDIELPKGKFMVEVEIRDVEDRATVRQFFVESR